MVLLSMKREILLKVFISIRNVLWGATIKDV